MSDYRLWTKKPSIQNLGLYLPLPSDGEYIVKD